MRCAPREWVSFEAACTNVTPKTQLPLAPLTSGIGILNTIFQES